MSFVYNELDVDPMEVKLLIDPDLINLLVSFEYNL